MKYLIKGIRPTQFTDSNTGEVIEGVSIHAEYSDCNVFGTAVDKIFVKTDKPYYQQIKPYVETSDKSKSPLDLIGKTIIVDRGKSGSIVSFEILFDEKKV